MAVTANRFMLLCYAAAFACGLSLLVTVFLFIKLNIISVIGDLSGISAKKGIEDIRKNNSISGNKGFKSSPINQERGTITAKISDTGSVEKMETVGGVNTEKIRYDNQAASSEYELEGTTLLTDLQYGSAADEQNEETVYAMAAMNYESESEGTTLLGSAPNPYFDDSTTVLPNDTDGTTILNTNEYISYGGSVTVEKEIKITNSNEIID